MERAVLAAGAGQHQRAKALHGDGAGRLKAQHQGAGILASIDQPGAVEQAIGGAGAGGVQGKGGGKAPALAQLVGEQIQRRGIFRVKALLLAGQRLQFVDVQAGAGDDQQAVVEGLGMFAEGFAQQAIQTLAQAFASVRCVQVIAWFMHFMQHKGLALGRLGVLQSLGCAW